MIKVEVRRGDGLRSGRVWLSSVVRNIQLSLEYAGHFIKADGKFGDGTGKVIRQFQNNNGIPPTGIADNSTGRQLEPHLAATVGKSEQATQKLLASFHGDLDWVHMHEGHCGRPYWPGGASGVTLDPGVDLGHVPEDRIESLYEGILTRPQVRLLARVCGI